ncbi:LysR family transcriptional regulator ArgP [Rhodococcus sp. BP-252]|uniref:Transcriptional regulator ArgP n=1 Tax=Rhodococcoides kyotonense TaxID=398843 RepID=A0A177YPZ5_9NOCA|nr:MULTISPECIES: LysR family transcriptional regulator ArgP [Rhodococcus]MBY6411459.1 LysR family transcriptional regulator ArgP [Rhodococcus sp. BP-320]MBY6416118.1 LysR family transcriptional regulator ArgP [Rhodococcus sp. BP-321]MBY6423558.1 LysR family transcriptional regulator ArgP [Rhodococcus sp. BP-324]MBY6426325.1 LysR family transcriptional regulator ArgP [Rhodococcus sp. BP-323]MBY6431134.1 LysR family transcriptional regulator ArgP [Rhodococcus sp. BP-322]
MSPFDLPQLDALAAAVDEGSFDAAARRLHVTPSAISQRVKAFETAAGVVLVQRSKPIRITEAGQPYLRLARQIRSLVADMHELGEAAAVPTVPIAVNGDSLNTWVLPALATLSDRMDFDVRREDQDHSAESLRQGVVMAAVTTSGEPVQGCSVSPLGIMRYRPMCSPDFRDRWFDESTSAGIARAPMIVFDRSDDLQDRYLKRYGHTRIDNRRHHVPASADFVEAVRLGIGWAVLPRQQSDRLERTGELIDMAPGTGVDVTLHWQRWSVRTEALDALTSAIQAAASMALT